MWGKSPRLVRGLGSQCVERLPGTCSTRYQTAAKRLLPGAGHPEGQGGYAGLLRSLVPGSHVTMRMVPSRTVGKHRESDRYASPCWMALVGPPLPGAWGRSGTPGGRTLARKGSRRGGAESCRAGGSQAAQRGEHPAVQCRPVCRKRFPLPQRALAIQEQALGATHPDVAQSLNNLAILYHDQGQYAEAVPLHQRALAIQEQALGPTHPAVATSLNNLADSIAPRASTRKLSPCTSGPWPSRSRRWVPPIPMSPPASTIWPLYQAQGQYAEAHPSPAVPGHLGTDPGPYPPRCRHQPQQPGPARLRTG